jgi:UDP:flavonoid glycosyltransferase YjiC (YdhE family)
MTAALSAPLARVVRGGVPGRAHAFALREPDALPPLLATSRVLDPLPAPGVLSTGWWPDPTAPRTLPAEAQRWLDASPGAVLLTIGSLPTSSARRDVERLAGVARSVGRPAVVQVRGARPQVWSGGLVVGEVDHRALLPRLAAVVHHGGSGTTHAVTAAGLPQVVVPHLGDQPHYGRAVRRAGLGPAPLPRAVATRPGLSDKLRLALDLGRDAATVRDAVVRMSAEDGLGAAVRAVGAMTA